MMKKLGNNIALFMKIALEKSTFEGVFPNDRKLSNVTPIYNGATMRTQRIIG
jgi:hypothetical protein